MKRNWIEMIRKTKIVATVGPACSDKALLASLIRAGADLLRINASHTTVQGLKQWIRFIRSVSKQISKPVAIMVDLQGPRVRTGSLKGRRAVPLLSGDEIGIIPGLKEGSEKRIATECLQFPDMVKAGDRVLIDNGLIELEVLGFSAKREVGCRVVRGGVLGENKGINIPNAPVTLPALTPKDKRDLAAAADLGIDYVALSFVRSEKDVLAVKGWLKTRKKDIPVIAKIEKPSAVTHIDSILPVADGIMVARGDLGIEKGVEKVPVIQKMLIEKANQRCIPVITATQMLESMIHQSHPTRAEVSDVANAVFDGTDAVMLSGETAIGDYPVECVKVMSNILAEAEKHAGRANPEELARDSYEHDDVTVHALTHAARHAANTLGAKAIVVFTRSGKTAAMVSKFRPRSFIIALPHTDEIVRRLTLYRGVLPLKIRHIRNTDEMLREADKTILYHRYLQRGDEVVVVSGRQALPGFRFMTKIHRIGEH